MLQFAFQEEQPEEFLEHQEQNSMGHLFKVAQLGASDATIFVSESSIKGHTSPKDG